MYRNVFPNMRNMRYFRSVRAYSTIASAHVLKPNIDMMMSYDMTLGPVKIYTWYSHMFIFIYINAQKIHSDTTVFMYKT